MSRYEAFCKACPCTFCPRASLAPGTGHRYYLCGEGCVVGALFEDSVHVFVERIGEAGRLVREPAAQRYALWPKHEVAERLTRGGWEIEPTRPSLAPPALPRSLGALHATR